MPRERPSSLGERLRKLRESRGWSLREVAAKAKVNHGYLSQVERGDVAEPSPSTLHKIVAGYEVPFLTLMEWAGYIDAPRRDLTANQAVALSYFGDDVSNEELAAIRAVLDAIRSRRATFSADAGSLDGRLSPEERAAIREHALKLLHRADALNVVPTPLDQVIQVARLVAAGEITLDEGEKRQLRKMFGALVDGVLGKLRGVIHLRAREIWVQPDLHELKRRFVIAHEISHDLLPWQRELAYLDDDARLRDDIRIRFEREANQAAIELLAQGDRLRREADDSPLSVSLLSSLSAKYQISLQATARRVVEETRKDAAMGIRFRGRDGGIGPYHVYASPTFEAKLGWAARGFLPAEARSAAQDADRALAAATFYALDLSAAFVEMSVETVTTPYAQIAIYLPTAKLRSGRRWLPVG
jgi:transcriptional regulator with XRE-family HTH domain